MSAELNGGPFEPGDTYQGMPVPRAPGALTVSERAAAVFAAVKSEEELKALAKESATIVTITNQDGLEQCHAARMVLKNTRLEIKRTGEDGRDDAVKTSKAIIARQNALIGIIQGEEDRLAAIQKVWDDRIEAEKEAAIQREIARVAEIQRRIEGIRAWAINATNQPSMLVGQMLASAQTYRIEPEVFEEHAETATAVLAASTAALTGLLAERKAFEAAQLQAEEDRKELVRLKAEEAERQRLAAIERAKAQAEADAAAQVERDRLDALSKAERQAEATRQAEASRIERERLAAEEAAQTAARERNEMALQEIQGIHQQLMIADVGRSPYCKGGDLHSIDWAIDGTEKWELTEERFGALYAAAVKTKETTLTALRQKRVDFIARQENAEEARRLAEQQAKFEAEQAAARKAAEPKPEPVKPMRTIERPSAAQIIACVAGHWSVSTEMAAKWVRHAKVELESVAA